MPLASPIPAPYRLPEVGGALTPPLQEHLRFGTLLAELSAGFVNVPASGVDCQIESALRSIVEHLGIDRCGLGQLAASPDRLVITHSYEVPGVPPSPRIIVDEQMPWYARTIRQGEPLGLPRLPDDLPPEAVRERAHCIQSGLKSNLTIPLKVEGSVVGGIGFASFRSYRDWPDDLVQRIRLIGDIFTNALARKRADEALQAREQSLRQAHAELRALASKLLTAQEEERRRIAREMHDDWTQRLAILGLDVARIEKSAGDAAAVILLLRTMQEQLVALSEDVHALSRHLHPSILDDLGLVEALRSECAAFARREQIAVDYVHDEVPRGLPRDVALCVYRVAQEALRNLAKHAAVKECRLTLTAAGRELELEVQDEGAGFDPAAARAVAGLGFASMEERVRLVHGRLCISSARGRGTMVVVSVPLEERTP